MAEQDLCCEHLRQGFGHRASGQSQMSSSSAGSFSPGSIASVSEAETCSGQTGWGGVLGVSKKQRRRETLGPPWCHLIVAHTPGLYSRISVAGGGHGQL